MFEKNIIYLWLQRRKNVGVDKDWQLSDVVQEIQKSLKLSHANTIRKCIRFFEAFWAKGYLWLGERKVGSGSKGKIKCQSEINELCKSFSDSGSISITRERINFMRLKAKKNLVGESSIRGTIKRMCPKVQKVNMQSQGATLVAGEKAAIARFRTFLQLLVRANLLQIPEFLNDLKNLEFKFIDILEEYNEKGYSHPASLMKSEIQKFYTSIKKIKTITIQSGWEMLGYKADDDLTITAVDEKSTLEMKEVKVGWVFQSIDGIILLSHLYCTNTNTNLVIHSCCLLFRAKSDNATSAR